MKMQKERCDIALYGRKMEETGLTAGSGGNISVLSPDRHRVAITPSGVTYDLIRPEDILVLDRSGTILEGEMSPSSETGFHLALYDLRDDIQAVVHTHSPYATTFACLGREIPSAHYLVGFCGRSVPVAPYATYGTPELAENITRTIGSCNAVLLANHGLVAVGTDVIRAFHTAEAIELAARICYQAECIGKPVILDDHEMDRVIRRFADYGPGSATDVP